MSGFMANTGARYMPSATDESNDTSCVVFQENPEKYINTYDSIQKATEAIEQECNDPNSEYIIISIPLDADYVLQAFKTVKMILLGANKSWNTLVMT